MKDVSQSRLAIIARILKLSIEGSKPEKLASECSLRLPQVRLYISCLTKGGLLEASQSHGLKTTKKGRSFLKDYDGIKEFVKIYS